MEDSDHNPEIVVCTQCLEVGADLDFDALVTEAASLDALRQRFGRLNRGGRDITPQAVIILPGEQNISVEKLDDIASCDPIYGNAIPRAWSWLESIAEEGTVDFGINAMTVAVKSFREANGSEAFAAMLSPVGQAPVILPAYLDCWVQTSPTPAADPDVTPFLHGPQRDMAEVQVCWRADLPEILNQQTWVETLSLCPPVTSECLPVPLHVFRTWMRTQAKFIDFSGDSSETSEPPQREKCDEIPRCAALIWCGPNKSRVLDRVSNIHPGDTIVLRAQGGGWKSLGILSDVVPDPDTMPGTLLRHQQLRLVDVAERGAKDTRRRAVLRIQPLLWSVPDSGTAAAELMDLATHQDKDWRRADIKELLHRLLKDETPGWNLDNTQRLVIQHLDCLTKLSDLRVDSYLDRQGFVISTKVLMNAEDAQDFEITETQSDELLEARKPVELSSHTHDVVSRVDSTLSLLPLAPWRDPLINAATLHDWGKADWRFQAMLRSSSVFAAMASDRILAKSNAISSSVAARREARRRAELPDYFRHEMLSVQMAESTDGSSELPVEEGHRELTLHLLATHHGYARPFAPVIEDDSPPNVCLSVREKQVLVTRKERVEHPSHALDSGITDRFWQLTRHHGWWGLALLETVLRLADQGASAEPSKPRQP